MITSCAKRFTLGGVILLAGLGVSTFFSDWEKKKGEDRDRVASETTSRSKANQENRERSENRSVAELLKEIETEFADLEAAKGVPLPEKKIRSMALLNRLRETLKGISRDAAATEIVKLLDSGRDYPTALGFTLFPGGLLNEAPTWRVALLDLLGQFSPLVAIDYARKIFDSPRSADEWVLGLRSLGWQNLTGDYTDEIRIRFAQMLDRDDWLVKPSAGYFQAFDVAVLLSGPTEFSALAAVMKLEDQNGTAVANGIDRAAFLAMDRIAVRQPAQTMAQLAADPQMLSWAPTQRGALVARADVTDPAQLQALEACLPSMAARPEEFKTFVRMFPNTNGAVTDGLVSSPEDLVFNADLVGRDQASLAQVKKWVQLNSYPALNDGLQQIVTRLGQFLAE